MTDIRPAENDSALPFKKGIKSVLKVNWPIKLKTPLCIRSGSSFSWKPVPKDKQKNRNIEVEYQWNRPKEGAYHEIADLSYALNVKKRQNVPAGELPLQLEYCYQAPASSIRGALRSWTIRRLVDEWLWNPAKNASETLEIDRKHPFSLPVLNPSLPKDGIPTKAIAQILAQRQNGFALLTGLFGTALELLKEKKDADMPGSALEEPEEKGNYGHAGRLRIAATPFQMQQRVPHLDADSWKKSGNEYGPENACRQISLRGPVDRITHGAKDGGLHTFLEFSPGQCFKVELTILNPTPGDVGMIALWEREMKNGLLRLGALTSVGRGQIEVRSDQSEYQLYTQYSNPPSEQQFPGITSQSQETDDILQGIWQGWRLDWKTHERVYIEALKQDLNRTGETHG